MIPGRLSNLSVTPWLSVHNERHPSRTVIRIKWSRVCGALRGASGTSPLSGRCVCGYHHLSWCGHSPLAAAEGSTLSLYPADGYQITFRLPAFTSNSVLKIVPSLCASHLSAFFSRLDARKRNVSIPGHEYFFLVRESTDKQPCKGTEPRGSASLEWEHLVLTWFNPHFGEKLELPLAH